MRRREFLGGLAGAAAAWSFAAEAQQSPSAIVGFLHGQSRQGYSSLFEAFRQSLRETLPGQHVVIEARWADNEPDRLPALAADLVRQNVSVIATAGGDSAAYAARNATSSVPIVFLIGGDPVSSGLATRLSRPGGNATGVTLMTASLELKRMEVLREAVPALDEIGILANRKNPRFTVDTNVVQTVAAAIGLKTVLFAVETEGEIQKAFARMREKQIRGVLALSDPFFNGIRTLLVGLAAEYEIPAIYHLRELAQAGGLMSYGASVPHLYRQLGVLVGKIVQGAKPADIPIEQPSKLELVVNLKTAKALRLSVPPSLLARADEVIE